jgi:hypothetical protein
MRRVSTSSQHSAAVNWRLVVAVAVFIPFAQKMFYRLSLFHFFTFCPHSRPSKVKK